MTDLHITWVDVAVAAILILSTLLALARGFVRETLSIFAWVAAAFATLYFGPYVVPLLALHMSEMPGRVLAYAILFCAVLIPLLFIRNHISRRVSESPIGGLDRVLGALFGAVRGLVAIAVLYILYSMVVPVSAQAKWMTNARTLSLIQESAGALLSLLPGDDARYVERHTRMSPAPATVSDEGPPAKSPLKARVLHASTGYPSVHKGYGAEDRRALNRLIETTADSVNEQ